MITRVVKLIFRQEETLNFEKIYYESKDKILTMEGCIYLSLHHDRLDTRIYFTISQWQDEDALNNYRNSFLFVETWKKTKALFDEKPQAWSIDLLNSNGQWEIS